MKNVIKCEYCLFTSESQSEMKEHEKSCSFNPSMKNCSTCKHCKYIKRLRTCLQDVPDFEKIFDKDLPCDFHDTEIIPSEEVLFDSVLSS